MDKVRPGIKHGLYYDNFGSWEKSIVKPLSEILYLTFAKKAQFKNSNYCFLFAKPAKEFTELFQHNREVLILFSDYEKFDGRIFDFVDKTITEFSNRLDKLCLILISKDENIKDKIETFRIQQPESRLVVPFTYNDFKNFSNIGDLFANRLQDFFYGRDLFAMESPLENDTYFFGRSEDIQYLYDKYRNGENSGLFGLRKIGKTSTLYALQRQMNLRSEPSIFIDCQDTGFHQRRWFEALKFIIDILVNDLKISRNLVHLSKVTMYNEKDASTAFEKDLQAISHYLENQRILLIFDEIESITFDISVSEHWANDKDFIFFWQTIRAIFQKNRQLFSFIITGVNPKAVETSVIQKYDNPIYRLVTPRYLGFFQTNQVKEMVNYIGHYMGLNFDEEVFTHLTEDYGGHPFLIRQVCSQIHQKQPKKRPTTVSTHYYSKSKDDFDTSLKDYVELILDILSTWYPIEYELLESLAIGDTDTFFEFVNDSSQFIEHLNGYGLVVREDNDFFFEIKAVQNYLIEKASYNEKLISPDQKLAEITQRRNKLEKDLRRIIKQILKLNFPSNPEAPFLQIVSPPKRQQKLSRLNINLLFESNETEIYFEDLKKVVSKNWPMFENLFKRDKTKFLTFMEYVNKNRIDAHPTEIKEDDFATLRMALSWLEDRCKDFLS